MQKRRRDKRVERNTRIVFSFQFLFTRPPAVAA